MASTPMSELLPVPTVGVICLRDDQVLLIKRGTAPRLGQWSLPGGRLERGETTRAGALRELAEETGVEAVLLGLVDVVDGLFTSRTTGTRASTFTASGVVALPTLPARSAASTRT